MNPDTTPTPRWVIKEGVFDGKLYLWDDRKYDNYDLETLCKILNEYEKKTNEVASDYVSDTPITSDLLEELKRPCEGDGKDLITLCREFERELAEKNNEVARLQEEIDKLWEALAEKENRRTPSTA